MDTEQTCYALLLDVFCGSLLSLLLFLISGRWSAIPLSAFLAFKLSQAKQSQQPSIGLSQDKREIQRLQSALAQQQEQHLATIRKMKLEQNQVLLKHHELQHILQQQQ